MKAVVYNQYGPPEVLEIQEVSKPIPKKDEVLIKVYATSVSAGDWRLRKADPFLARLFNGLFKPKKVKILGFELAGVIEQVGKEVTSFKNGDAVFAFCGLKFGGYAEYCCLQENDIIVLKPANISFVEAATIPLGSLTALAFLQKAAIAAHHKVLIYGASGSVGTFAVQLSKWFGAETTAVCSTQNIDLVKSLGADKVIDYTTTNITTLAEQFDIIFDAVGKTTKSACRKILKPQGKFVTVRGRVIPTKKDLQFISGLIELKKITSVIDRVYQMNQIQEAHHYVEQFRKKGNVSLQIIEQ